MSNYNKETLKEIRLFVEKHTNINISDNVKVLPNIGECNEADEYNWYNQPPKGIEQAEHYDDGNSHDVSTLDRYTYKDITIVVYSNNAESYCDVTQNEEYTIKKWLNDWADNNSGELPEKWMENGWKI